ncbi:MAG: hypothetical protein EZS28_011398, partial [Streblomastix strix]
MKLASKSQQAPNGAKYILMANQANSKKRKRLQWQHQPTIQIEVANPKFHNPLCKHRTYPYIVELQQPPTLIHMQSLSYETQISEVNLAYCDVRGREIGVCGAMFHVEQGDVSIYNCTFRGPESVYDLSSTPQFHEILQRTATVYLGIKCNLIYISNTQYYGLYQRANQVSNDSSNAARGVAITFKRGLSKDKFIQLFNDSFERCWDVTTYLSGTATSACLIDTDTDELENPILGNITFKDCQFKSCRGRRCGAVFVASMNKITSIQFMGCNFTDNDFTGAWPVVMGAHSRDVALFDEQKIDMTKSHYKDTETFQNITGKTEIGFWGCLTTTSALQLSVIFQGVEGGSSSWLLSAYTFAREYYITRPDLKDFCNAIEVSGINSQLLLNKVYMSTDSKETNSKYWLRSFIRVSGGSVSINSCNFVNMSTLVSAVDINGSVKVILIDDVGFTNTIRRNVNQWGWAGAININVYKSSNMTSNDN